MQVPLLPAQVDREGIEAITRADIDAARQAGKRWKLICQAERTGGGVHARVQPVELDTSDPLYFVNGTSSALTLRTDVLGDLTLTETDPGPHTTAFGLLADFINAVRVR
jgi:homoserine dehydrogenase